MWNSGGQTFLLAQKWIVRYFSLNKLIYLEDEARNIYDQIDELYYLIANMEALPYEIHKYPKCKATVWFYKDIMVGEYFDSQDMDEVLLKKYEWLK